MARVNRGQAKPRARPAGRRPAVPGRDPMPKSRRALINGLHAWYEDAVETINPRFFEVKTILWIHKGPSAVPGGGMKLTQLQGLWHDTALFKRMRDDPARLKRAAFGPGL